jgi:outer membrane receptor for ferric coprogen and ferric-rhodotorulic acid
MSSAPGRRACALGYSGLVLSIAACGAWAPSALAQERAHDSEPLEEIVVTSAYTVNDRLDTATGLGLTLQETPQSVSIMTEQRIADQNLGSLTDVVLNAVGVSAREFDSSRYGFSARGFAIHNYQLDGVPMAWSPGGDSGETQVDTALYERIEVVRGATGLLTGAGDPSASINLVRKHATARDFTGRISAEGGSWESYGIMGDVGAGLNSEGTIRARVVGKYRDEGSFRDLAGNEKTVLYGVVEADITQSTLIRLGASYQDNDPTATTWGGLPIWYADGSRTDWARSKTVAADWTAWATRNENYFLNLSHDFANGWHFQVNLNRSRSTAGLNLLYLFGTPDRDTGLGLGASPYNSDTKSAQNSIDAQLKGNVELFGRAHELVFGTLHSEQKTSALSRAALTIADVGNFNVWDGSYPEPQWSDSQSVDVADKTKQTGFYGAARLNFSDNFKVILGGRVANWTQTGVSYGTAIDYGDKGVVIPYAGALLDITPHHSLYASYTEIFQPQDAQDYQGNYLDPLTGKSYEVGLKSRFLNDALQTTASLFMIQQDNLAVTDPDPTHLVPGTIFQASMAIQGTETKGFELEMVGEPLPGWNISLGYTWFKAEDEAGAAVTTDQPRQLFKLFTTYRLPDGLDRLTIGGGLNWEGRNYTDATNPVTSDPERLQQKSYALASLMARYDVTEQIAVQANLENLFNKTYYSQIGFYSQYRYGAPRNFTLGATYSF